jgi:hypothetical protein
MISGEFIAATPIYGYRKMPDGKWEVDVQAAIVIREMYQPAAQGLRIGEIRDKLTEARYPIPREHIKRNKGYDVKPACLWTDQSIRGILKNIQYTGAYVSGKILTNCETGKKYHTAQSDWVIIPDKNPPVVSKELFDEVQVILADDKSGRKNMLTKDHLLRGDIVKCGSCGYCLSYDDTIRNPLYRCHHTYADKSAKCHKLKISAAKLDEIVLALIRKQAEAVLNSGELSELRKSGADGKCVAEYEKEIQKCVTERQQVYEKFILHDIDRDVCQSLKDDCAARIDKLNNQIAVLKQAERDKQSGHKSAVIAKKVLNGATNNREIVEMLIDKVWVFPGNKIEVLWKVADFAVVE